MSRTRSERSDVALIIATALLVLAAHRYFETKVKASPAIDGDGPSLCSPSLQSDIVQTGRGRISRSPFRIPLVGWKDILWRTYGQIGEDRLLATAAGVVFFGLLAVFPAITALVSSYGLFTDPATIANNLQSLSLMLPDGSFQIVQDQITRVLAEGNVSLSATFVLGLALALWSANAGVKAIIDALNVVYGEKEKRGFFQLNLISLGFTVGAIAALLAMVGAVIALPLALHHIGLAAESKTIVAAARWPLLAIMLLFALGLLYRFGPSRRSPRWDWMGVDTIAAVLFWMAGSSMLSWYLSNFGNYTATYGSLGAAIGLMTWIWMSAIIVLCGAELNSEIDHQTSVDTTVEPEKPLGRRGATTADTVVSAYS